MIILITEGWLRTGADDQAMFFRELTREIIPEHPLYAVDSAIVAHREGTDDILVQHLRQPGRFSVVHLTWSNRPEIDAAHPMIEYDGPSAGFLAYERAWLHSASDP
jgi:hypothetical protein